MLEQLEAIAPAGKAIPDLSSVFTSEDVSIKKVVSETGKSYSADYVNWARVAHLLHQHAPGWEFHLTPSPDGGHVWAAPNGTGYIVGHFIGPDGHRTPDFPQAVMNNRNSPKAMAELSARDLTDTHRRCLCTAAAATFGLAWQLWAKEQVEDPHRSDGHTAVSPQQPRANHAASPDQERQKFVKAAREQLISLGLTAVGAQAAAMELSKGTSQLFSNIPIHHLQRIADEGVPANVIERWNAANSTASGSSIADQALPAAVGAAS